LKNTDLKRLIKVDRVTDQLLKYQLLDVKLTLFSLVWHLNF